MKLESCANLVVKSFFQKLLSRSPRRNKRRDALVFPSSDKMRFRFTARRDYANVSQLGRFDGDEQKWSGLSAPKLKVDAKRLRFRVYTGADVELFEQTITQDLPKIVWTAGLSNEEEADEEEDGE
jgi:hypothetical protein